jgi:hypothetical protein
VRVLAAVAVLGLVGQAAGPGAAPDPRASHERSSGVAVVGGGFIAVTVVWVTPGLTAHPYYAGWVSEADRRARHREVASSHTLFLVELANRSALRLDGYLSLNLRMVADGQVSAPDWDPVLRARIPDLMSAPVRQTFAPHTVSLTAAAFAPVPRPARTVTLVVPPLWLYQGRRQIGQTPAFDLRFHPDRLAFPP